MNVKFAREDERRHQAVHAADESRESRAAKTANSTCFGSYRMASASHALAPWIVNGKMKK
ncbi:MAG: hypothetical protein GYA29_08230 [Methanothrix sp.]|jgi:hypothetical protein|nr:hypothetical protein [Methanothrix sp.]